MKPATQKQLDEIKKLAKQFCTQGSSFHNNCWKTALQPNVSVSDTKSLHFIGLKMVNLTTVLLKKFALIRAFKDVKFGDMDKMTGLSEEEAKFAIKQFKEAIKDLGDMEKELDYIAKQIAKEDT